MQKVPRYNSAYEQILKKILNSELKPNEPLSEESLALELNVSRTPIRAAFKRLENAKLIEIIPYRGAYVRKITLQDINEIFLIREALESICAKIACEKIDIININKFEDSLRKSECLYRQGLLDQSSEIGNTIHDGIIKIAGNERILQIISDIHLQTVRLKKIVANLPGRLERSNEEHRQILNALRNKDPQETESAMRRHIISTKEDLIGALFNHD